MPPRMRDQVVSDPVRTLDNVRPRQAKAGLLKSDGRTVSDQVSLAFVAVVKDAVLRYYGSVKAAAISLDVDPSLMMREFDAGKFGRLSRCDDAGKAFIAKAMQEAFGHSDPKAQARRVIREARQRLDDLAELLA